MFSKGYLKQKLWLFIAIAMSLIAVGYFGWRWLEEGFDPLFCRIEIYNHTGEHLIVHPCLVRANEMPVDWQKTAKYFSVFHVEPGLNVIDGRLAKFATDGIFIVELDNNILLQYHVEWLAGMKYQTLQIEPDTKIYLLKKSSEPPIDLHKYDDYKRTSKSFAFRANPFPISPERIDSLDDFKEKETITSF